MSPSTALSAAVLATAAALLTSCGGGSSGSDANASSSTLPAPAPTPTPAPGSVVPLGIDVRAAMPTPAGSVPARLTRFATGLQAPWAMAFLPDGRLLVTQKAGSLVLVSANGATVSPPISGVPAVDSGGQGGLLDVVLDPQFATNRRVYLAFAEPGANNTNGTAVARGELNAGATALVNVSVIFRQQPKKAGTQNHYGSRLVFRSDGTLFVALGDRFNFSAEAQDLASQLGKVVRITTDGAPAAGNPFLAQGGNAASVWSLGHRNAQAAAVNPATGELWVAEHGPQGGDEINVALAGRNFGWPTVAYGCNYGVPVATTCWIGGGTHQGAFTPPLAYWYPTSPAPGGMLFYSGRRFPEWQGNLLVGGLAGRTLYRFVLSAGGITAVESLFAGQHEIRDIEQGPDGELYLISRNDNAIFRIDR
jgi:aldose sugar dehydrogenase